MFGWVDAGKRKFFALVLLLIVVEIILVVLMARDEHARFPPVPGDNERLRVGKLRSVSTPSVTAS